MAKRGGKITNLKGQRFGKLKTVKYYKRKRKWLCRCDCGNTTEVRSYDLRQGRTKSCGCLKKRNYHLVLNLEWNGKHSIPHLETDEIWETDLNL